MVVDEPKTSPYGGVVAAPAFRAIAVNTLAYLKITPKGETGKATRTIEAQSAPPPKTLAESEEDDAPGATAEVAVMPDFRGMSMRRVMQVMEKRGINIRLMGSGRAVEQNPPPGQTIRGADEVWIKFAPSA